MYQDILGKNWRNILKNINRCRGGTFKNLPRRVSSLKNPAAAAMDISGIM